jgi:uncharacterized protein with ParB-like and HNH nuclease domain
MGFKMKANEINIIRFLSQSDTQFVIPVYQRNYDWTYIQCKQLLNDILEIGSKDEITAHFIGSIVFIHDDLYSSSGIRELTIIDGQQRLTTLMIIYIAIRHLAAELKEVSLVNRINETYLINKFADEDGKLKLKPTDNNEVAFNTLLNDKEKEFVEYSKVVENYRYFTSRISAENYNIILKGLSKIMFVEISLERGKDDPQKIFESLNSTGLELSQSDLIRNYILMGLDRKSQLKIYNNYWKDIELLSKDNKTNLSTLSDYIRDYLTLENKKIPNKNKVYQEFKSKYPTTTLASLEAILFPIKKMATYYNKFINPENEHDETIRTQLCHIKRLEINVVFPFLLKVYDDYENKTITQEIIIEIMELIQSFTWRRFIVGLPTNALNKIFMRLYEDVDPSNYLYSVQKALLSKKGSQRFPLDAEVSHALKEKDMYGITQKNIKYFFERIENYNSKEKIDIFSKNITIEHIFPQNPDKKWKDELGTSEYNLIKNDYLNTISNLTLSANNGSLQNKVFSEKRDMNLDGKEQGYKFSKLWLNKYLKDQTKWTTQQLNERFEIIRDRFLLIWKIPNIKIEDSDLDEINIFDAEEPKGKKIAYAIFREQKLNVQDITKLYIEIMKILFELEPKRFFASDITHIISLTKNKEKCRRAIELNEVYYIESNIDSNGKFERIKKTLEILGFEDDLFIKYKKN